MRRLIVTIRADEFTRLLGESMIRKVKSLEINGADFMEVLSFLEQNPKEFVAICRVKFKDPNATLKNLSVEPSDVIQLLNTGKDRAFTFLYKEYRTLTLSVEASGLQVVTSLLQLR